MLTRAASATVLLALASGALISETAAMQAMFADQRSDFRQVPHLMPQGVWSKNSAELQLAGTMGLQPASKNAMSARRRIEFRQRRLSMAPVAGASMSFVLQPWQLLMTILAGWVNQQQQQVIEYLRTENQVLKEMHGKKRILLNDDQRRRLAVKGKVLGRKLLGEIGTLVTPDTILRWHRMLVAEKWNHADKRKSTGRPPTPQEVVDLVLKFATENLTWGYDRIADALANLGHEVSDQTVGNILKSHGIEPAPVASDR